MDDAKTIINRALMYVDKSDEVWWDLIVSEAFEFDKEELDLSFLPDEIEKTTGNRVQLETYLYKAYLVHLIRDEHRTCLVIYHRDELKLIQLIEEE